MPDSMSEAFDEDAAWEAVREAEMEQRRKRSSMSMSAASRPSQPPQASTGYALTAPSDAMSRTGSNNASATSSVPQSGRGKIPEAVPSSAEQRAKDGFERYFAGQSVMKSGLTRDPAGAYT